MVDIEVVGRRQIVFKGDQETSTKAPQRELAARRPDMKLENSLKCHSAANGRVENAMRRVIGLTRVLKDALEANIKQAIEPNMPSDDVQGEPRCDHHEQVLRGSR